MEGNLVANILIVDDKKENLSALESLLRHPSLHIVKAQSGNDALGKLLEMSFACVLLDINMPDMDGFEVVRLIREDEAIKSVPVLFVTAYPRNDAAISKGYQYGAVDFLFKPLEADVVRGKVSVFAELYRKQQTIALQRAQLQRVNLELSTSNAELERFAYIASHDLQEPLRTISNYVTLLSRQLEGKLDENSKQYVHFVCDASRRMQTLIKAILDLSQTGTKVEVFESVDCFKIVENTKGNLALAIQEANAKVVASELPVVKGDAPLLDQLFQNLVSNAIKYRRQHIAPEIRISGQRRDGEWLFSVSDNGMGIESHHLNRIFEPFYRIHGKEIAGAGIGLATCKKIVQRHCGRIWGESKFGQGTTFYFTLSCAPSPCASVPN